MGEQMLASNNLVGAKGHLAPAADLNVAYSMHARGTDCATALNISLATVRRSEHIVAQCRLKVDETDTAKTLVLTQHTSPLAAWRVVMHDTAKIFMVSTLRGEEVRSSIDILVSRSFLISVWLSHAIIQEYVDPPRRVCDTGYGSIYDGLWTMEPYRKRAETTRAILDNAAVSGDVVGSDGAYGNEKMNAVVACKKRQSGSEDLDDDVHCVNHVYHLIESKGEALSGRWRLKKIKKYTSLLKSAGYFGRVRAGVGVAMQRNMRIRPGHPPPHALEFRRILRKTLVFFKFLFAKALEKAEDRASHRGTIRFLNRFDAFMDVFNGWLPGAEYYEHYAGDGIPDVDDLHRRGRAVTLDFLFASACTAPEEGKWTKTGPALDTVCTSLLCGGIVKDCVVVGLGPLNLPEEELPNGQKMQELSFQQASGIRYKDSRDILQLSDETEGLIQLWIVNMSVRTLTAWGLRKSSEFIDPNSTPAVLDLTNKHESPGTVCRQWLSSVVSGQAPQLKLLYMAFGHATWAEYCRHRPRSAAALRGMARNTDSWIERRVIRDWQCKLHNSVHQVADARQSVLHRTSVANDVHFSNLCCSGYFVAGVKKQLAHSTDLLDEQWFIVFKSHAYAKSLAISVASLERRNKRSRDIASSDSLAFENFQAVHTNKEALQIHKTTLHFNKHAAVPGGSTDQMEQRVEDTKAKPNATPPRRAKHPKEIFKTEICRIRRAFPTVSDWFEEIPGETRAKRMARMNTRVAELWEDLSPEETHHYECVALKHNAQVATAGPRAPAPPALALACHTPFAGWLPQQRTSASHSSEDMVCSPCFQSVASVAPAPTESGHPLSITSFLRARSTYRTKTECNKAFLQQAEQIGTDRHELPTRANYFNACLDGACRSKVDRGCRSMIRNATMAIAKLHKRYDCTLHEIAREEVCIAIELRLPTGTDEYVSELLGVGVLSSLSGLSGHHQETFALQLHEHSPGSGVSPRMGGKSGTVLYPRRGPYVESNRSTAKELDGGDLGGLLYLLEEDLFRHAQLTSSVVLRNEDNPLYCLRFLNCNGEPGRVWGVSG